MKEITAMIHSINLYGLVEIISHKDNNHVIAKYQGKYCTAIFNVYRGLYYVDDIFGVQPDGCTLAGY